VVLGCLVLALGAVFAPFARLSHQSLTGDGGGAPLWTFLPFGVVGIVAPGIVPIGLAVLLFPDGTPPSPLLRRVLWLYLVPVDRWFNRARYDAGQTVAAFAARLKDTVDLDSVRDDLTGVVH
jgi:hypothetical protein